jgi:hypothetical protein
MLAMKSEMREGHKDDNGGGWNNAKWRDEDGFNMMCAFLMRGLRSWSMFLVAFRETFYLSALHPLHWIFKVHNSYVRFYARPYLSC